ncbi:ATP-binding protein, partial [bacterium]|nr:ATP-binding protein [candidate division CSSED10-310 bacterium]
MTEQTLYTKSFHVEGSDFQNAGSVSKQVKKILKQLNIDADTIWRVMIVCYEAEMNAILYANQCEVTLTILPDRIHLMLVDDGPGIPDIEKALTEGFSTATREMRERGFGAGLGLPNIRKTSDEFDIVSTVGVGTT